MGQEINDLANLIEALDTQIAEDNYKVQLDAIIQSMDKFTHKMILADAKIKIEEKDANQQYINYETKLVQNPKLTADQNS
jgi:hypothetical protein